MGRTDLRFIANSISARSDNYPFSKKRVPGVNGSNTEWIAPKQLPEIIRETKKKDARSCGYQNSVSRTKMTLLDRP